MEISLLDFATREEPRAASAQQRAFWLANEVDPGTPAFNLLRVLQLKGVVDKTSLALAFNQLVTRHEVLRTGLVERDGMVLQRSVGAKALYTGGRVGSADVSNGVRSRRTAALPSGAGALGRRRASACDRVPSRHYRWVIDGAVL
jgi:Condensation domain